MNSSTDKNSNDTKNLKTVIVGESNIGKSCLLERMATDQFFDALTTIGVAYQVIPFTSNVNIRAWDTAGTERFAAVMKLYLRGVDCALVCFSIDNLDSFRAVQKHVESIRDVNDYNVPIVLIVTKTDLPGKIAIDQIHNTAKELMIDGPIFTSAKTDTKKDLCDRMQSFFLKVNKMQRVESTSIAPMCITRESNNCCY